MVELVLKERYAIQRQLGKNAGRKTVLARDLQTQELVAIKILTFGADCQWDELKLFEREAETLQSLCHPAIPRYLDHFEFQNRKTKGFALVQSYIEAKSLAEWVEWGRNFNELEIKQLAQSLLEILIYLQSQHPPVIHRDIKPSNILLAAADGNNIGQVYLVDFGSVQTLAAREGSTITVVGTYGYMPPEQFGGRAVPASDLYGLGATLIYLVTGVHPAELPQEDLRIKFEPKIHLTSDFVDWLTWMTEPDLNSRLTSAEKALKALVEPRIELLPSVLPKPANSKVQLKKDRDNLEMRIPASSGNYFLIGFLLLFLIPLFQLFLMGIALIVGAFFIGSFPSNLFMGIGGIVLISLFFLPIWGIIKLFPKPTRLRIDRQRISLNKLAPSPRRAICKLGFIAGYYTKSGVHRNIQIWAGTREYKLITSHLRDAEIDWIAVELSEWLDLPITQ
ncbi:MAG TPA: serine/threonine protein kinase [Cyanobacteria bacterium UBA8803]|nr:serine/threonine protein kinase [Cyanobacteria bacterium UBA9273]HBL59725.1 serine/threonine protein kinase [Cyanobacteria bacterium UBA8803]